MARTSSNRLAAKASRGDDAAYGVAVAGSDRIPGDLMDVGAASDDPFPVIEVAVDQQLFLR